MSLGVACAATCPDVVSLLHAADTALCSAEGGGGGRASAHHHPHPAAPKIPLTLAPA